MVSREAHRRKAWAETVPYWSGKKSAVIQAAKRIKREGGELTYAAVVAAAPTAVLNPDTGEAVDKKLVFTVFREDCYTDDPEDRWDNRTRLSRSALSDKEIQKRYDLSHEGLNSQ